jgi:hypothetical protein
MDAFRVPPRPKGEDVESHDSVGISLNLKKKVYHQPRIVEKQRGLILRTGTHWQWRH